MPTATKSRSSVGGRIKLFLAVGLSLIVVLVILPHIGTFWGSEDTSLPTVAVGPSLPPGRHSITFRDYWPAGEIPWRVTYTVGGMLIPVDETEYQHGTEWTRTIPYVKGIYYATSVSTNFWNLGETWCEIRIDGKAYVRSTTLGPNGKPSSSSARCEIQP